MTGTFSQTVGSYTATLDIITDSEGAFEDCRAIGLTYEEPSRQVNYAAPAGISDVDLAGNLTDLCARMATQENVGTILVNEEFAGTAGEGESAVTRTLVVNSFLSNTDGISIACTVTETSEGSNVWGGVGNGSILDALGFAQYQLQLTADYLAGQALAP